MSIEIINKLKPATFKYNDLIPQLNDGKVHMGFMAQDLQKVFGEDHAVVIEDGKTRFLMVQHHELIAPLTKAVQELSKKVTYLEAQLNNRETKK